MRNGLLALAACFALLLGGCGAKDTTEPPAELTEFEPEAAFRVPWSRDTGKGAGQFLLELRPWVGSDAVYTADHRGRLVAVDKETGKVIWKVDTGHPISGGVGGGAGTGMVFVGTSDGRLAAYWQRNGEQVWESRLSSEMLAVPVADSGVVVARTGDGNLEAFSVTTGEKRWSYKYSVPSLSLRGTATPVIFSGGVITGTDSGHLTGIDLTSGRLLFETPVAMPSGHSELSRMIDVDAPVAVDRAVIYAGAYQGQVVAFDMQRGRVGWSREKSVFQPMALDGNNLYLVDDRSHVWALDKLTGATVWVQEKLQARPVSGVAVLDDAVILGDFEGYLHALDTSDGRFIARKRFDGGIAATPVVEDGRAYIFTREGELSVVELQREQ